MIVLCAIAESHFCECAFCVLWFYQFSGWSYFYWKDSRFTWYHSSLFSIFVIKVLKFCLKLETILLEGNVNEILMRLYYTRRPTNKKKTQSLVIGTCEFIFFFFYWGRGVGCWSPPEGGQTWHGFSCQQHGSVLRREARNEDLKRGVR